MKNLSPNSIIPPEGITHFTPPPLICYLSRPNDQIAEHVSKRLRAFIKKASWFVIVWLIQLVIPVAASAQMEEEEPDASLVCVQIQVFDLAQISGASMYASSPFSNYPNTINICKAADFEISDDPFVPQGRCHVPPAENENPKMYILYLLSSNQAATLPAIGTVVPQSTGPWSTVLNASSIPAYNQNNFPPPSGVGIFNAFSISTPGQYAVIAVLCTLNANNQYEIVTSNAGSPV